MLAVATEAGPVIYCVCGQRGSEEEIRHHLYLTQDLTTEPHYIAEQGPAEQHSFEDPHGTLATVTVLPVEGAGDDGADEDICGLQSGDLVTATATTKAMVMGKEVVETSTIHGTLVGFRRMVAYEAGRSGLYRLDDASQNPYAGQPDRPVRLFVEIRSATGDRLPAANPWGHLAVRENSGITPEGNILLALDTSENTVGPMTVDGALWVEENMTPALRKDRLLARFARQDAVGAAALNAAIDALIEDARNEGAHYGAIMAFERGY